MPLAAPQSPVQPFPAVRSTLALVEPHNASDGDSGEYLGCTEVREKRRACFDGRCAVRETCQLWTRRDDPGYAIRVMTWRDHWLCFDLPCRYHLPVTP